MSPFSLMPVGVADLARDSVSGRRAATVVIDVRSFAQQWSVRIVTFKNRTLSPAAKLVVGCIHLTARQNARRPIS
jgi:hypothetical protein